MAAATPRIIVVGGGLAGLAAVIKIAEAGGQGRPVFDCAGEALALGVCARRAASTRRRILKGEGDSVLKHFDDTVYGGDFLANQTPVKQMTAQGPAIIDLLDRMGVPLNRNAGRVAGLPPLWRNVVSTHGVCRRDDGGSSFCMRSTSRCGATRPRARSRSMRAGSSSPPCWDRRARPRGICAMDLRSMETRTFPADAVIICTGGNGAIFGQEHELGGVYGFGAVGAVPAGRGVCERRVHPGASDGDSRRGQAAVDVGKRARRRWPRVGCRRTRTTTRTARSIPEGDRWYFLEEWLSEVRATLCLAMWRRAPSSRWCTSMAWASTRQPMGVTWT